MPRSGSKSVLRFLWPDGVVLLAALAFLRPGGLPPWSFPLVQGYAYIVLAAGILLGWYARRSRTLFAVLLLVLVDRALRFISTSGAGDPALADTLFNAVALLLP